MIGQLTNDTAGSLAAAGNDSQFFVSGVVRGKTLEATRLSREGAKLDGPPDELGVTVPRSDRGSTFFSSAIPLQNRFLLLTWPLASTILNTLLDARLFDGTTGEMSEWLPIDSGGMFQGLAGSPDGYHALVLVWHFDASFWNLRIGLRPMTVEPVHRRRAVR